MNSFSIRIVFSYFISKNNNMNWVPFHFQLIMKLLNIRSPSEMNFALSAATNLHHFRMLWILIVTVGKTEICLPQMKQSRKNGTFFKQ